MFETKDSNNPDNIVNKLQDQLETADSLVADLAKMQTEAFSNRDVRFFEGIEGLKSFMKIALTQKTYFSLGGTGKLYDLFEKHAPHLLREALKLFTNKVKMRIIAHKDLFEHKILKIPNVEVRSIDALSPATTVVFDDFIAMHYITDNPFVIMIRNKEIVESYKNYFEYVWKSAKPYKK
jgi:hypothetical protein